MKGYADGHLITETDLKKIVSYLEDAAKIYDALGVLSMQRARCRSHMIKQLTTKLKNKLKKPN